MKLRLLFIFALISSATFAQDNLIVNLGVNYSPRAAIINRNALRNTLVDSTYFDSRNMHEFTLNLGFNIMSKYTAELNGGYSTFLVDEVRNYQILENVGDTVRTLGETKFEHFKIGVNNQFRLVRSKSVNLFAIVGFDYYLNRSITYSKSNVYVALITGSFTDYGVNRYPDIDFKDANSNYWRVRAGVGFDLFLSYNLSFKSTLTYGYSSIPTYGETVGLGSFNAHEVFVSGGLNYYFTKAPK